LAASSNVRKGCSMGGDARRRTVVDRFVHPV
jgi:hypothetical protein